MTVPIHTRKTETVRVEVVEHDRPHYRPVIIIIAVMWLGLLGVTGWGVARIKALRPPLPVAGQPAVTTHLEKSPQGWSRVYGKLQWGGLVVIVLALVLVVYGLLAVDDSKTGSA